MIEPERRARQTRIVAALLNGTAAGDAEGESRRAEARTWARMAWARQRCAALRRAQRKADAAWMTLVARYDDAEEAEMPELEPPPEQAEVDAIWAELQAVIVQDRWPAHLHWSC